MRTYTGIRKGIFRHNISICKRYILEEGIPKMKQSRNVFVFADNISNIYEMPKQQHKNFFMATSQKDKKVPPK